MPRIFIKPDGTLIQSLFIDRAKIEGESHLDFLDRASAKTRLDAFPHVDLDDVAMPPRTLPDGTCGRCRWRVQDRAVVVNPLAPCTCGKDEYLAIKAKIENRDNAIAMQGLLELERFKLQNMSRRSL